MIVVVTLIAILGTGAVLGYKRSSANASFQKVIRDLNAIDLAKQTWLQYNQDPSLWPSSEVDRWSRLQNYLGTASLGTETPSGSGFYSYPNFSPKGYTYQVSSLTNPAAAMFGATPVKRPF